jgi:signal transduction histidine kinase
MHERAASLGGVLTVDSARARGTVIELRFPA